MSDTQQETQTTKARSEAPIAALVLGVIALIAGFVANGPGIPLIAGVIALLAGAVVITKTQREHLPMNWLALSGVLAAVIGIIIGLARYAG